jgi:hypothetical protein
MLSSFVHFHGRCPGSALNTSASGATVVLFADFPVDTAKGEWFQVIRIRYVEDVQDETICECTFVLVYYTLCIWYILCVH